MIDVVHRNTDAATYVDASTGVAYEQMGDTVLAFGQRGGIVQRTRNAHQPSSERSEHLIGFTTDASLMLGPADRPDIPIESASFKDVTLRHKPFDFLDVAFPPRIFSVDAVGGAGTVENNPNRMAHLKLSTGPAAGGRVKIYAPRMAMRPVPRFGILWCFDIPGAAGQFVEYGLHDNFGADGITLQRVDTGIEGGWWGVVKVAGAPVYTKLINPDTGLHYKTGPGRKFLVVMIVHDGAEFYGGADGDNVGCLLGRYVGPLPTVPLLPYLSIESTAPGERLLYSTHGEVVWPG